MGQLTSRYAGGSLGRRSFIHGAASAGLFAAATPALNLLSAAPASGSNWRGLVGDIKPRANDSALVEMIKLLPDGIGVAPVFLNFAEGTREELQNSYATYERNIVISPRCPATPSVSRARRPS